MATDLLLDDDDDLLVQQGDLVLGDSLQQEVDLVVRTSQGDWRNSPLTGFGVGRRTRAVVQREAFASELTAQLELDGMQEVAVELSPEGKLAINAKRYD